MAKAVSRNRQTKEGVAALHCAASASYDVILGRVGFAYPPFARSCALAPVFLSQAPFFPFTPSSSSLHACFAMPIQQCHCFSMCTVDEARQFHRNLPGPINRSSPWAGYLDAVYGTEARLPWPFDLRSLTMFYHNDRRWSSRHPTTEWPMATCARRAQPESRGLSWNGPTTTACPSHICARWTVPPPLPEAAYSASALLPPMILLPEIGRQPPDITTVGAYWPLQPAALGGYAAADGAESISPNSSVPMASLTPSRVRWAATRSGGWVEVLREPSGLEGQAGYGCWFTPASGTGVCWVHVD